MERKLKLNIVFNVIYHVLVVIIPVITAPYVSRVLLPEGIGIYSYSLSLVTYFTMIAALGTLSYGTRRIAQQRNDRKAYSKSFWEIEILSIFTSLVSLSFWFILALNYREYSVYLFILSFNIVGSLLDISWLYAGLEKFKYSVFVNMFFKISGAVLVFVLIKSPEDLWKYMLINSMAVFLGNLSMWLFLPKTICKTSISMANLGNHFKETMIYFVPTIATTIYTVLDKSLIGILITGESKRILESGEEIIVKTSELENGYYEQATRIVGILKALTFVGINGVMESRASFLYSQSNEAKVKKYLNITLSITLFLSIGAAFGISGLSSEFVPAFFGYGYDKTIILLYILSAIVPIICVSYTLGSIFYTPSGRRKQSSSFLIFGSIINLVLNIPFIIAFHSIGAAISSIIAELVISLLYIWKCRIITFREMFKLLWKKIIAGFLMLSCIVIFKQSSSVNNEYVMMILTTILGFFMYVLCLLALNDDFIIFCCDYFKRRFKKNE